MYQAVYAMKKTGSTYCTVVQFPETAYFNWRRKVWKITETVWTPVKKETAWALPTTPLFAHAKIL